MRGILCIARHARPPARFPSPPFGHLSPMGRGIAGAEPAGLCGGAAAECGVVPVAAILHPGRLMRGSAVVPANCSWGGALDGDGDGVPCEALCR